LFALTDRLTSTPVDEEAEMVSATSSTYEEECTIPLSSVQQLRGHLSVPHDAAGVVLFAHGNGSSRRSPRNRYVAWSLREAGLATLLLDLLTPEEEARDARSGRFRFDIELLAQRLLKATEWLAGNASSEQLPIGCFGASTGAGAALVAAAKRPELVGAVVSRGGRPDLAGHWLPKVTSPTLLIVGGRDEPVLARNQTALRKLGSAAKQLVLVPGATHLFEEDGALEEVARLAGAWFRRYLSHPLPHHPPSLPRHPR
jgi:dienelactone hydrolase